MFKHVTLSVLYVVGFLILAGCASTERKPVQMSDAQVEDLVTRSYQYVALYNVNNKTAEQIGGWNKVKADTEFKDHTYTETARPNNDVLCVRAVLDLRKDAVIMDVPAFDSKYVSLMATAYDHYIKVPMSTRKGDFWMPEKILFYSERTEGYSGEAVKGVDRICEMTGDFVTTVLRVMPQANEPMKFHRNVKRMREIKLTTLTEFSKGKTKPVDDIEFPLLGRTDADIFENNLLEVMQFVFNHTTFDPEDEIDRGLLAVYKPLGVEPGKKYDPARVALLDGKRMRRASEAVASENIAFMNDLVRKAKILPYCGQPKGETNLDALVATSVTEPTGLPLEEVAYPAVMAEDGNSLNAMNDYVIRMTRNELPKAKAFWSLTLYDQKNGYFIPNDRNKYSVGENTGLKFNADGGVAIYVAAEPPAGVPEENWLPINRRDEDISLVLRVYVPDLEKMENWTPPKAERL
jgi:hypothetical protein